MYSSLLIVLLCTVIAAAGTAPSLVFDHSFEDTKLGETFPATWTIYKADGSEYVTEIAAGGKDGKQALAVSGQGQHIALNETNERKFLTKYELDVQERQKVMRELSLMGVTAIQLMPSVEAVCKKALEDLIGLHPIEPRK